MIFVGDDWAEDHHDVHLMDDSGMRLMGLEPRASGNRVLIGGTLFLSRRPVSVVNS
ncbi:hypothetical protein AAHS21_31920 [Mycobacterium sp. 050272]|uniref:hypothetical protein n=1 Tax=Mycobacterium sp. 050272 TaxID=3142488 RepID=UPI0031983F28